jgi:HD-GYP domain-containing protein (c-di-GMP phosphodiesterase class II)
MGLNKIKITDDFIRIGIICLCLVIVYLFIITPLRLNSTGYYFFQNIIAQNAYHLFYATHRKPLITIISLDDKSLKEEGLKWPWRRAKFAELIDKISIHQPGVIAVDISFVGKSNYGPEDDQQLIESARRAQHLVLASYIGEDNRLVAPFEGLREQATGVGFVNKVKDEYSFVRYARAVAMPGHQVDYSFEIKSASIYEKIPLSDLEISGRDLSLGNKILRLNWDGTFPIKYTQKPDNFDTISVSDIFSGSFDTSLIKERLVIIGMTAESLHDIYLTPLGSMPGVVISANVMDNILGNNILKKLPPLLVFILFIMLIILTAYTGFRYSLIYSLAFTSLSAGLLYLLAVFAFKANIEIDAFGGLVLVYSGMIASRFYLSAKSYIEKSSFVIEDLRQKNKKLMNKVAESDSQIKELKDSYLTVISSLVKALEEKDVYSAGHSERVADYSEALAKQLNLQDPYKQTLKKASLLHDIGKISIPDNILHKQGALTEDEKSIVKRHELESVKILEPSTFLRDAIPLILHHHEHYDGGGYPHGLAGEMIPLGARIIAICDAFDAMTSGRGYNRPLNVDEAIAALKENAGRQFDPKLVGKFIEVIKELSSGRQF